MNEKKEFLNEERYQKNKKKISGIALIVLIIGLLIGGSLITIGLIKQSRVNSSYSSESKANLEKEIETEKQNLETKKAQLTSKGIKYDSFAKYDDGERYDLKVITQALDPSFNYCNFDEAKNNSYTSKYCSLKNELKSKTDFNKEFDSSHSIPFYMIGSFVIIASCMIAGSIYMVSKQREILAFQAQQVMPVAQEGIEKMTPTVGKSAGTIAREITKGIKDGLKDDEK